MSEAIATYTEAEYLAVEERSELRHEFVGGRVYQMSGGTERHELAVASLARRLHPAARSSGCRTFANRQLRVPSGDHYYPDVMVACGKAANPLYEERPTLIIEVLSPSTAGEDRKGKLRAYATVETLERYVLVDPVFRRFEVYRQASGTASDPGRWSRPATASSTSTSSTTTSRAKRRPEPYSVITDDHGVNRDQPKPPRPSGCRRGAKQPRRGRRRSGPRPRPAAGAGAGSGTGRRSPSSP